MARKKKTNGNGADHGEGEFGEGHNAMTLERAAEGAAEIIAEIEESQAQIDAINEQAKDDKAVHVDNIATLRKRCRDEFNIEAKALSTILTKRRQERRMAARIEALKESARQQFDQIEMQFGGPAVDPDAPVKAEFETAAA